MKKVNLPGNQEKIDVAPPKGKITAADFAALRNKKGVKKEVNTPNPPTDYSGKPSIPGLGPIVDMEEGKDHEVAMAMSSLKEIIEAAQELMSKLGGQERDIPGWIQNHITNAENYITQASQGFHELEGDEEHEEDTSLMKMMQELKAGEETPKPKPSNSKDKITSKSDLAKKFREFAAQLPNIQGIDTKEANGLYQLIKDMLNKSQKGSVGTNVMNTTKVFNKTTSALEK